MGRHSFKKSAWNIPVIKFDNDEGLAHARSQSALCVELRVANTYAGYLQSQGDSKTAEDILQQVLNQFNDSTHSSDIDAGRKLLSQLRAGEPASGPLVDATRA